jgi:pimeloyl-ACP methyl ester carboxylesterase
VLVFVHGAMDRGTSFDRVRRRFTTNTTVAYDRRGYAGSTHLLGGADAFHDHVNDLGLILDELPEVVGHDVESVVLIGHSAGSNVVFAVSASRPEVIGTVTFEPPMPWLDWWPSSAGGSTLAVFEADGPEAAAESFMRRIVGDQTWERLPIATQAARRAEGAALVADLTTLRGRPVQFEHRAITVPSVVGRGELSQAHQRRSSEVAVELLGAVGRLVDIPGASHGAHGSHPDQFANLVKLVGGVPGRT